MFSEVIGMFCIILKQMDLIIQDYKNRLTWFLRNLQKNPIPTLVVDRVFGVTDKTVSKHRIFRVVGFRDSL